MEVFAWVKEFSGVEVFAWMEEFCWGGGVYWSGGVWLILLSCRSISERCSSTKLEIEDERDRLSDMGILFSCQTFQLSKLFN